MRKVEFQPEVWRGIQFRTDNFVWYTMIFCCEVYDFVL